MWALDVERHWIWVNSQNVFYIVHVWNLTWKPRLSSVELHRDRSKPGFNIDQLGIDRTHWPEGERNKRVSQCAWWRVEQEMIIRQILKIEMWGDDGSLACTPIMKYTLIVGPKQHLKDSQTVRNKSLWSETMNCLAPVLRVWRKQVNAGPPAQYHPLSEAWGC